MHSTKLQNTAQCHICHEPFLSGSHPERPVVLRCGHILGEGCILKWIAPLSRSGGQNSCPMCRSIIVDLRAPEVPTTRRTRTTHSENSGRYIFWNQLWIDVRPFFAILGVLVFIFVILLTIKRMTTPKRSIASDSWSRLFQCSIVNSAPNQSEVGGPEVDFFLVELPW